MKIGKKPYYRISILVITLLLLSLASVFLFPTLIDFSMEKTKLLHVLKKIRLPELMIAITAGAALGLSGAIMQILLDNPLASPFTLGISSASAFGASTAIILGVSHGITWLNTSLFAFIFASLSTCIVLIVSSCLGISKRTIILIGMSVNFFFSSANTLLQYYAPSDAVYRIMFWSTGSLTNATISDSLGLFIVFLVSISISMLFSKDMAIIQQGERNAVMHGVNVSLERILFLLVASLLASYSVSIVGVIGFIGLVAPHISRLLGLESPKLLLLSSGVTGALLLVIADDISKSLINPTILPISAVTSVLGIPFLLFLLFFRRKKKR